MESVKISRSKTTEKQAFCSQIRLQAVWPAAMISGVEGGSVSAPREPPEGGTTNFFDLLKIRNRIQSILEKLPPGKLEIALTFLELLEKTGEEESRKFLIPPGFAEGYLYEKRIQIRNAESRRESPEERHRKGYMEQPVQPGEFSDWKDEQIRI